MSTIDTKPALLSVTDLAIRCGTGTLLEGMSFAVERGSFVAVVGESGSGKTMIARSILGLLPPGVTQSAGRICFENEELNTHCPKRMRVLRGAAIGMVFQEPMVSLNPAMTIGAQLAEGLRLHRRLSNADIERRSLAMLERVKIVEPRRCLRAYPHEFSGGMRQRIMLASVMLLQPKLLIADEPTTALDPLAQRDVLDLMRELAAASGTAVMLITHNLGLVERYASEAIVLRHGRLIEHGSTHQILREPREQYTRNLVGALPKRAARPARRHVDTPLLAANNIAVTYPGRRQLFKHEADRQVLDEVSVCVHAGETVALVGGSGSGKTTLGRAMLGLTPLQSGEISFRGRALQGMSREAFREFRLACQLVYQDPYSSLNPRMRIAEIVAEPLAHVPGLSAAQRRARVATMLEEVGLAQHGERVPHQLSGGQRQRVAIARAIVRSPAMIVADEPVSALDLSVQQQVLTLLTELQKRHGFGCLFITHDFAAVEQIADRIVVMHLGRIVEQGTRSEILDSPRDEYTRSLLDAAPRPRLIDHHSDANRYAEG